MFNFFKKLFYGNAYESAKAPQDGRSTSIIVADARDELSGANRLKIISAARALVRNFGFAREQVNAMEIYAVGDGIVPQPASASPEWNEQIEKLWNELFAPRADLSGRFSFAKLTRLACRALDTDGEIFFVWTNAENGLPRLKVYEAHRISQRTDGVARIFDGIRYGKNGEPVGYIFTDGAGTEVEISAQYVFHVFIAERVSDAHGAPQIQHSIPSLRDASDLLKSEKRAVLQMNEMTWSITSDKNELGATSGDFVYGSGGNGSGTDPEALKRIYGGGKIAKLLPGEKLERVNIDRPSATFSGFLDYTLRDASLGNVPYEFVSDSSKIGGAGVRLVVGRAARVFARRQQELIETFLKPVWERFVFWAVATKRIADREDMLAVEWACPRSVTVDAGREAANDRADMEAGLISKRDLFAMRGMRYETEIRQIAKERELEERLGLLTSSS